jgi:hypothetical protein
MRVLRGSPTNPRDARWERKGTKSAGAAPKAPEKAPDCSPPVRAAIANLSPKATREDPE